MSDIDDVLPQPVTLSIAGETVTLHKLRFGQVPAFAAVAVRPWPLLAEGRWLDAAIVHNADIRAALALLCDRPEAWLAALDVEDFVNLAAAAFGMNMDFFVQAVIPAVRRATLTLVPAGLISVTDSSVPVTALRMS